MGDFSDGLGSNVTITSEADGTFMFFGHGEKVAKWMCGDTRIKSEQDMNKKIDLLSEQMKLSSFLSAAGIAIDLEDRSLFGRIRQLGRR